MWLADPCAQSGSRLTTHGELLYSKVLVQL